MWFWLVPLLVLVLTAAIVLPIALTSGSNDGQVTAEQSQSATPSRPRPPSEFFLQQAPGVGKAFTYGGTPIFDACEVISLVDITEVGAVPKDKKILETADIENTHLLADGQIGPDEDADKGASAGVSGCSMHFGDLNMISVQIYQPPFNGDSKDRERFERMLTPEGASIRVGDGAPIVNNQVVGDTMVNGMRAVTLREVGTNNWFVGLLAPGFYANVKFSFSKPEQLAVPSEQILQGLIDLATKHLSQEPTGPTTYYFPQPYSGVKSPCSLFSGNDFVAAYGEPDVGRVVENYGLAETNFVSGSTGGEMSPHVLTSCKRENPSAARIGASEKPVHSIEARFENFRETQAASSRNNWDCGDQPGEPRDYTPERVSPKIGDALTCLVPYSKTRGLTFVVGKVKVELLTRESYATSSDSLRVLEKAAEAIAKRLKS